MIGYSYVKMQLKLVFIHIYSKKGNYIELNYWHDLFQGRKKIDVGHRLNFLLLVLVTVSDTFAVILVQHDRLESGLFEP